MTFDPRKFVLVGDTDVCEHTSEQLERCSRMEMDLKGVILCNEPRHADTDACKKIAAFPAFCNVETNMCASGLRETQSEFDELATLTTRKG